MTDTSVRSATPAADATRRALRPVDAPPPGTPVPERAPSLLRRTLAVLDPAPPTGRPTPRWVRHYTTSLVMTDLGLILIAVVGGFVVRFAVFGAVDVSAGAYLAVSLVLVLGWLAALGVAGAYEARHISAGSEEFKRVILGTVFAAGAVAIVCYVGRIGIARGFVGAAVPLGLVLLVLGRRLSRQLVRTRRAAGEWTYRILVAGTWTSVQHVVDIARTAPHAGLTVVGACVEDVAPGAEVAPGVPVLGGVTGIVEAAARIDADAVAVSAAGLGPRTIRELGWALEGTGRDLVMVPGLTEVAGPRVHVTPVEGLPLMWVDRPVLRGYKRILKRGFDLAVAGGLLVAVAPLFAVLAALIRVDSPGPVFFRQERFGKAGRPFRIWKFRSMTDGAAAEHLRVMTEAGSAEGRLFFKVADDPRVTRVGKVLRALSLDELPQLINVVQGTMSLVGPRPQCDHEVAAYDDATRRRLLVKPGMTGLWQVSGRSDLPPEDGVRLDLYYVENWSLALDMALIGRTAHAVLRRRGAY